MSKELIGSHSVHETLVRQTQIDAARIEELERDLLNLVCRIHRDGGHYIAKHGEAKAIADADTVAAQNNADLDALQADNAELVAALESVEWTQLGEMPEGKHCCYCGALEKHGHVTGCKVAISLKRTTLAQALSKLRKP